MSQALATADQVGCWRDVGTWSAQGATCDKLTAVVHCQNCEVYIGAGRRLLDTNIAEGEIDAYTHEVSQPIQVGRRADQDSVVLFRVASEWFGISADACVTISPMGPIHSVPHRRGTVLLGLTPVRGRLLLCVSLAAVLGVDEVLHERFVKRARLVVVGPVSEPWAFAADEVAGVERIDLADVREASGVLSAEAQSYGRGGVRIGDRFVTLLEHSRLSAEVSERVGG